VRSWPHPATRHPAATGPRRRPQAHPAAKGEADRLQRQARLTQQQHGRHGAGYPVLDERSLADACFSEDQECLRLAIGRLIQDLSNCGQLSLAANENSPGRGVRSHESSSRRRKAGSQPRLTEKPEGLSARSEEWHPMRMLSHEHSVEMSDFTTRRSPRCLVRESTCMFDAAVLW
jgi:hypothetical protein